jgi:peptidoglycan/xylan/chitin deacetylase (PgdA/CDA1 family)
MRVTFQHAMTARRPTQLALRVSRRHLRVLAYHGVPSIARFAEHLDFLIREFHLVSGREVAASHAEGVQLPPRCAWITFDDGDPTVIDNALPLLLERSVPATMFVCPGLLDTSEPYWWVIAARAVESGVAGDIMGSSITPSEAVSRLKRLADTERRAIIAHLRERLVRKDPALVVQRQLTTTELLAWTAGGLEVGNHTWDHPLLDGCTREEQRRQVRQAHDALRDALGWEPSSFAYPNGNFDADTERELERLGYSLAVGFDHRLSRRGQCALRVSRLRIDATAGLPRLRAITSGLHSTVLAGATRVSPQLRAADSARRFPR